MRALGILLFPLLIALCRPAMAASVCGLDVPDENIRGEKWSGSAEFDFDNSKRKGWTARACWQSSELYAVYEEEYGDGKQLVAFHREDTLLNPDSLNDLELNLDQRRYFIESMVGRARIVINRAATSGWVKDPEVQKYLVRVGQLLAGRPPISDLAPSRISACQGKSNAHLKGYTSFSPGAVTYPDQRMTYLCRDAYAMEGPTLLIHEMVHVLRSSEDLSDRPYEECIAELVARTAVETAQLYDSKSVPAHWINPSNGYEGSCSPKFAARFAKMRAQIDAAFVARANKK